MPHSAGGATAQLARRRAPRMISEKIPDLPTPFFFSRSPFFFFMLISFAHAGVFVSPVPLVLLELDW